MFEIIEKLLLERGLTAYQLSKGTGIPQASLSDWKVGKSQPNVKNLQTLSDYFGVSVDFLLGREE